MNWKPPKWTQAQWAAKKAKKWNPKWNARKSRESWFGVSWKFFAGLGIGAAIGMVFAPKSGAELRDDLQGFARDSFEQGRERLHETVDPVVAQARERLEPVVDSIGESVQSAKEELGSRASRIRDRVAEEAASVKEQVLHRGLLAILNEWPHERLIEINGIGPVLASKIIQHRPYESEEELLSAKYLPPSAIESLRKAA
jgi:gas vesicle protein